MQLMASQRVLPARSWLPWCMGLALVSVSMTSPFLLQRYVALDPTVLVTFGYAAVFAMGLVGSMTFFLPIPCLAVVFAGGSVLHPGMLGLSAGAGIATGMTASYLLGKAGDGTLHRVTTGRNSLLAAAITHVVGWFTRYSIRASFLLALVPNPVFDYAGIIAGAGRISLWRFLLGTFAGKTVQAGIVAVAGYYAAGPLQALW